MKYITKLTGALIIALSLYALVTATVQEIPFGKMHIMNFFAVIFGIRLFVVKLEPEEWSNDRIMKGLLIFYLVFLVIFDIYDIYSLITSPAEILDASSGQTRLMEAVFANIYFRTEHSEKNNSEKKIG